MKRITAVLGAVLTIGLAAGVDAADGPFRLSVRVIRIPAEQSFKTEVPDGRGGTVSLQVSGNVVSGFPKGTVIIPTELAWNASEDALGRAIGEHIGFRCGGLDAERIRVGEIGSCDLSLSKSKPAQLARFEESRGEGRSADYELRAEVLTDAHAKFLVRLQLDVGSSWQAGTLAGGIIGRVVSVVAEVPESRLLLVGAPGDKAVYFLAVSVVSR
jgi:hypothetical protein